MEELTWGFTKREKIGLFGIATIVLLLLFLNNFYQKTTEKNQFNESNTFQQAIEQANKERELLAQVKIEKKQAYENRFKNKKYPKKNESKFQAKEKNQAAQIKKLKESKDNSIPVTFQLSTFNPNIANLETLINLGLSKRTAQTIINFRNKGGKFLKAEDLKVVYGISEKIYQNLKDYILIPNKDSKPPTHKTKLKPVLKIAINVSSAEEWMELRGIGPTLSNRIVKYRDKLGGFASIDQLTEVYNLPDSTFQNIKAQLTLTQAITKQSINALNFKQLISHPYINKSMAGKIISRKDRNEKFNSWKEFQDFLKITPKQLENIQYYFTIP